MRILVVSNQYAPVIGGIEILLTQLLPELRDLGHEIEVVASVHAEAREASTVVDGFPVHRTQLILAVTHRDPARLLRERNALNRIVEGFQPDLIHAHDVGPNLWALAKQGGDAPILTTLHLGLGKIELTRRGPMASVLRQSDWVTGVSDAVITDAIDLEPTLAGRTSVITNGIALPDEAAPYDPASKLVVCIGRMVQQKGFDVAVRAFGQVLAEHPSARLVFAGDGEERPMLEELASSLAIAGSIDFRGAMRHEEIAGLLSEAAVVVLPSRFEGMPLVALEAAGACRPVVSTATHGLGDVVLPGVTGTIVEQEDPIALAAAINELLSDPVTAATYGRAAFDRAHREHSLQRCAREYDELFARLVPSPVGRRSADSR